MPDGRSPASRVGNAAAAYDDIYGSASRDSCAAHGFCLSAAAATAAVAKLRRPAAAATAAEAEEIHAPAGLAQPGKAQRPAAQ
ncbi:MAG: hypothetical protein DBX49_07015, partial [Clostridia bacterium]